jgi:two-component system sensor histidine kinase UhpB
VQEALSNVWRHANTKHASIELQYLPKLVQVSIRDNGKGFAADEQPGMGLSSMRERALLIGADLTITSSPQKGCTVDLALSLVE